MKPTLILCLLTSGLACATPRAEGPDDTRSTRVFRDTVTLSEATAVECEGSILLERTKNGLVPAITRISGDCETTNQAGRIRLGREVVHPGAYVLFLRVADQKFVQVEFEVELNERQANTLNRWPLGVVCWQNSWRNEHVGSAIGLTGQFSRGVLGLIEMDYRAIDESTRADLLADHRLWNAQFLRDGIGIRSLIAGVERAPYAARLRASGAFPEGALFELIRTDPNQAKRLLRELPLLMNTRLLISLHLTGVVPEGLDAYLESAQIPEDSLRLMPAEERIAIRAANDAVEIIRREMTPIRNALLSTLAEQTLAEQPSTSEVGAEPESVDLEIAEELAPPVDCDDVNLVFGLSYTTTKTSVVEGLPPI